MPTTEAQFQPDSDKCCFDFGWGETTAFWSSFDRADLDCWEEDLENAGLIGLHNFCTTSNVSCSMLDYAN